MLTFAISHGFSARQVNIKATYRCSRRSTRMVTSETSGTQHSGLRPGEILVRFTNTPNGPDELAAASPGDILMTVGDSVGIKIPRACVSGLCGSCTCDVVTENGETEVVRACQTSVVDMTGSGEMVVDLSRMKETRSRKMKNPMARFDNLDTEYRAGAQPVRGLAGMTTEAPCQECNSRGDVICYGCEGRGNPIDHRGVLIENEICMLCAGSGTLRCAGCQGEGVVRTR